MGPVDGAAELATLKTVANDSRVQGCADALLPENTLGCHSAHPLQPGVGPGTG